MRLFTGIALFLLSMLSGPAAADTPLVFSSSSVEPWGYFLDDHQPQGLLVAFNRALQEQMQQASGSGLRFTNHVRPYPRVIHDIKTGTADFAVLFVSPESEQIARRVATISRFEIRVTGRPGTPALSQLQDLAGKRVGYVRGSKYGPAFDNSTALIKVPLSSMVKGLQMLEKGRVDALICLDQTLFYALKQRPNIPVKTLLVQGYADAALYLSRHSDPALAGPAAAAVKQLQQAGAVQAIFDRNRPE